MSKGAVVDVKRVRVEDRYVSWWTRGEDQTRARVEEGTSRTFKDFLVQRSMKGQVLTKAARCRL